jgi:transcription initiation factor TFIIIB Brf1 subunit/transcription initiation factor TFIIB
MGEISALSGVPPKRMNRIVQLLAKESSTDAKVSSGSAPGVGYVQLLPADLIGRMASQLKLPHRLTTVARDSCQRIVQCDLMSGHSPQVVAAGVIALTCVAAKEKYNLMDLIKVSFSSEQSIKRIYHQLQQDSLTIFSREFITSIGGITQLPLHLPSESSL